MKRWGPWIVAAVVGVQFLVPLVSLLVPEPPTRLGWQMYSVLGAFDVVVRDADGQVLEAEWAPQVLPRAMRPELDWSRHLPERICAEVPEAASISIVPEGGEAVTVPCSV